MVYDVIIVGAGSAGCVLANRISEDPSRSVLLIETGPVFLPNEFPPELLESDRITRTGEFTWGLRSEAGPHAPAFDVAAARVAGGGSTVNAGNIRRPRKDDFHRWTDQGVAGWSFPEVVSTYKAIENTTEGSDDFHGRTGPLPVRQLTLSEATQTQRAFVKACVEAGFPAIAEYDGPEQRGVAFMARNVVDDVRMNAGIVYLTTEVRARPNLAIRQGVLVDRIDFEGRRAVGVQLLGGESLRSRETILSAGVYGSPAVLMRSGVGPAAHLTELGIEVVADLPVGEGLRDHPVYFNTYALKEGVRDMHPACGTVLATPATRSGKQDLDLWVFAYNLLVPPGKGGKPTLLMGSAVMRPLSRGTVRLRSRDPTDAPVIDFNLLSDPTDRKRMLEAVRLARQLSQSQPLADLIAQELAPGPDAVDDAGLLAAIDQALTTYDHGCCTVRMGADGDPLAVTDRSGRVQHLDGLRVVDASIFPDTVSVPLNFTVMMLAERIAGEMRAAVQSQATRQG